MTRFILFRTSLPAATARALCLAAATLVLASCGHQAPSTAPAAPTVPQPMRR